MTEQRMPRNLTRTTRVDRAFHFQCFDDAQAYAWEIEDHPDNDRFTARVTTLENGLHRVAFYDGDGSLAGFLAD